MSELTTLFARTNVQEKFEKMLGKKAQGFMSSVLQTVNNNKLLANANPTSILTAAATAASLDLPINQSLGYAWIVPYKGQAQFQLGWKGFVQLALRTGQYRKINVVAVHEDQFISFNALTEELDVDFSVNGSGKVVGYAAYFILNNGFDKTIYWSREKVEAHAKKFSKSYASQYGSVWKDDFDAMAKKTVLKSILSKWGILSIEMQTAITSDQAVIEDDVPKYVDNDRLLEPDPQVEENRIKDFVEKATTIEELQKIEDSLILEEALTEERQELINNAKEKL